MVKGGNNNDDRERGVKKQYRKMESVTGNGTKKRERKKNTLRCRELQAVVAGSMVGGKDRDVVCSHLFLTVAGGSLFRIFRIRKVSSKVQP